MMTANGLAKLVEECGELLQVAGKKLAYYGTDDHPDGAGALSERMEDEMGDVRAAIAFVVETFHLDPERIDLRRRQKLAQFRKWHAEP